MKKTDFFVFAIDLVLFTYFTQIALNTTNMTVRVVSCFAMTTEIFFMIQHIKIIKVLQQKRQD